MINVAVMVSGRGRVVEYILNELKNNQAPFKICGLISSNSEAKALSLADAHNIPSVVLSPKEYQFEDWDIKVKNQLTKWNTDWVLLSGFLSKIGPEVLNGFPERIINSHPSLLPKFGGAGMYGSRVHNAVIQSNETVSGVTVHLVNEEYDKGKILGQKSIQLSKDETALSLEAKILDIEKSFVFEILKETIVNKFQS